MATVSSPSFGGHPTSFEPLTQDLSAPVSQPTSSPTSNQAPSDDVSRRHITMFADEKDKREAARQKQTLFRQAIHTHMAKLEADAESKRLTDNQVEDLLHEGEQWFRTADGTEVNVTSYQSNKTNQDNWALKEVTITVNGQKRKILLATTVDGHGNSDVTEYAGDNLNNHLGVDLEEAYKSAPDGRPSSECITSALSRS